MKRRPILVSAVLLAVVGACQRQPEPPRPAPAARPNIVLVTIDTLRADRLRRGLTPNLDALASRGTSYRNVRAPVPLTLPSHVSIMTGTHPYAHGVRENGVVFDGKVPTLAQQLKKAGYRTGAFVGAYVLNRRFGLSAGFDVYDDDVRRDMAKAEQLEAERPAGEVVDRALTWLAGASGPYFLWVHVYDPHAPYAPPPEFLAKAQGHAYDGEVAYADAQVGRLLEAVNSRGGQTAIVVAADHGEGLGDHGEQTHGMLAYDSTLRVPLIAWAPWMINTRFEDSPVSLTDVAGSLLAAAGLAPPGVNHGLLLKRPDDTTSHFPYESIVYAETRYPRRVGWHPLAVLVDDQWKLIASSETELYKVRDDPEERSNVAAAHESVVQAMQAQLRKLQTNAVADARIAPEAAERLRALGYVSGTGVAGKPDAAAPNPAHHIASWTEFEGALAELQAGRAGAVLPLLRGLATKHPTASVFQSTYARALRETGRARESMAVYRSAVARWPNDATLFHDLAVAAREAGDTAEALRAEQAALALDGNSAMALNGIGLLYADAGRHGDAATAFDKATRQDPTNASYWTNLGNARRGLDDAPGAEVAYRKALEVDSGFPDALNGLGTLFVQSRRAADAIPMFERALTRDPQLHEARLNLGIAYQQTGQREKAAAAYRALLAKAPPSLVREREAATQLLRQLR